MAIVISKLHPMFVGEVAGADLSKRMNEVTSGFIQAALDEHAVLLFHGTPMAEEAQIAFATRFGPLEPLNGVLTTGVTPRIGRQLADISNLDENGAVLSQPDRRRMFALGNQLWHTDASFKCIPAKYSLLHAHSVTPEGGETQFVDTRAAYDALPPKMKERIETLIAEHSIFSSRAKLGFTDFSEEERRALPPVRRSLVRVHPGSGRKALYIGSHASHIVGWPVPDGRMLISELMEHATQPQFVYTHKWAVGDLTIWDNRCTLHRGRPYDEGNHRRDMRRATIQDLDPAAQDLSAA
jgi:alpha-ketoglutarate-dependent 2,4-dichlorophenoxyacetate dioxygenase